MVNSIPIRLLVESKSCIITIETRKGDRYRGNLKSIEENLNCCLENVILLQPNNSAKKFASVFLRGSHVNMILIPDVLGESPIIISKL